MIIITDAKITDFENGDIEYTANGVVYTASNAFDFVANTPHMGTLYYHDNNGARVYSTNQEHDFEEFENYLALLVASFFFFL